MKILKNNPLPLGILALILGKRYYGALTKCLENLDIERYYAVLYFVYLNDGCRQQHICDNLAVDKTAMVKVIEYLVRKGYIRRKSNPADRREQFVFLTVKGRKQAAVITDAFHELDKKAFKGMSSAEHKRFLKLMEKLTHHLDVLPSNELWFNFRKTATDKDPAKKKSAQSPKTK